MSLFVILPQNLPHEAIELITWYCHGTAIQWGRSCEWASVAGQGSGRIVQVHKSEVNHKGYMHHASERESQYEIKSDETDHIAMHKGRAV
jgi:Hypervirulence associated proteins TUDOR domain